MHSAAACLCPALLLLWTSLLAAAVSPAVSPTVGAGGAAAAVQHAGAAAGAAAAEVARSAERVHGGLPVADALRQLQLAPPEVKQASRLLQSQGLRTALDLRLLGGGDEAAELLEQLRAGGLSIGGRSKIRLLTGDRMRLGEILAPTERVPTEVTRGGLGDQAATEQLTARRRMFSEQTSVDNHRKMPLGNPVSTGIWRELQEPAEGMSADTVWQSPFALWLRTVPSRAA
eukprot:SAG31_NODE_2642_length_5323_cov_3.407351_3_plen_230_part_00